MYWNAVNYEVLKFLTGTYWSYWYKEQTVSIWEANDLQYDFVAYFWSFWASKQIIVCMEEKNPLGELSRQRNICHILKKQNMWENEK